MQLTTLELPFAYIEHGEPKNALVKVVLCPRCVKKLMWKRRKDKEEKEMRERGVDPGNFAEVGGVSEDESESGEEEEDAMEKAERKGKGKEREKLPHGRGGMRDDEDSHVRSVSAVEVEGRSKKYRIGDHGSKCSEGHERTTRESHSRRRSSRSRSPRRHHGDSHSHSHSHSRNRSRERDRRRV